ncbi:serine/threonine-protein kinase [Streptomyces sp. NPDC059385]|uniref:serine/threonine-protein kinase n=1 Tax=Streptomyces sp. NPDC059385 TaxID=3346817 RepID=UPI0036A83FBE
MAAVFPRGLAQRFSPVRLLGQGGMGTVFEAEDTDLRRRVAVKVLSTYGTVSERAAERFRAEARALARISHPNVVGVYERGIDEGTPYLVMEFLDGSDVSDLVRDANRALPVGEACRIAADTLAGLGAAHREGVLHRDVKPANIRVTADGRVVLYDFGLARLTDEEAITATGEDLMGTPRYMAPERITGWPPQPASDVYGVGACLYFMLTGTDPFGDAEDVGVLLFRAVHEGMPSLRDAGPEFPPGLADAVHALSARDPATRTSRADAAEALIRPWADAEDVTPDHHPSGQAVRPWDNHASDREDRSWADHASGREERPEEDTAVPEVPFPDERASGPFPPPPQAAPVPWPDDAETTAVPLGEAPEYDWQRVDVLPAHRPAPESGGVALSEVTRGLVRSRMTEQTALSRQREAVGLIQRGRLNEAMDRLGGLGAFCAETLGQGHPTTLACHYWQAVCLARQGKAAQALELFARVTAHHGHGRGTEDE